VIEETPSASALWDVGVSAHDQLGVQAFFSDQCLVGVETKYSWIYGNIDAWIIRELEIPALKTARIRISVELIDTSSGKFDEARKALLDPVVGDEPR
jgi:hypothetical protein